MSNKTVSLLVLLCVVVVLIWGTLNPGNTLFFFISSNKWLSIIRLLAAGSLVWLSSNNIVRTPERIRLAYKAGLAIMATGSFLFLLTQIQMTVLVDFFKPLDLLLLVEAGVLLTSISLTATAAPVRKKARSRNFALLLSLKAASKVFSIT